eukprot:3853454-Pleurochrysis_carterae.AAC.1
MQRLVQLICVLASLSASSKGQVECRKGRESERQTATQLASRNLFRMHARGNGQCALMVVPMQLVL